MEEIRLDTKNPENLEPEEGARCARLVHEINQTFPLDPKLPALLSELFGSNAGENLRLNPPLFGAAFNHVRIGRDVFINSNCLLMARGEITIEDGVMIAANAQIISNNHDPYDLSVLTLKPVVIKKSAWIGAGATILPGVTIGKHAVIGAASVVTHDVPDYAVAVGNPARVVKFLEKEKFKD